MGNVWPVHLGYSGQTRLEPSASYTWATPARSHSVTNARFARRERSESTTLATQGKSGRLRRSRSGSRRRRWCASLIASAVVLGVAGVIVVGAWSQSACTGIDPAATLDTAEPADSLTNSLDSIRRSLAIDYCAAPNTALSFGGPAGAAIDDRTWNHEVGGNGWGNNELQTYTASSRNSHVDGHENLVITARREQAVGDDGIAAAYSSARITTEGKVEFMPGSYVEAWLRAPTGAGLWPAFWLIGTNHRDVGWPASGELDVMEAVGSAPTIVRQTIHLASSDDPAKDMPYGDGVAGSSTRLPEPVDSGLHSYGVYFDQDVVRFYVDRQERYSVTAEEARRSGRSWPFGGSQFMILNVAVGGIAHSPRNTSFPRELTVAGIFSWHGGERPAIEPETSPRAMP